MTLQLLRMASNLDFGDLDTEALGRLYDVMNGRDATGQDEVDR